MRTELERERRDREADKKLHEERMERARLEQRMERAQLESQMKEVKAEMREQLRALQSNHAHHHLPIDPRYDAHQLAHLRQVALQPPRSSQVPELPAQQPPRMESRAQAAELQQPRSASSAISGLESAAPRAQPRATAPEQGQSTASPPPPAVATVTTAPPPLAEAKPAAQHQPAPESEPHRSRAPTKSATAAAVPVPDNLDSHFFIRSVRERERAHRCGSELTPHLCPLCL